LPPITWFLANQVRSMCVFSVHAFRGPKWPLGLQPGVLAAGFVAYEPDAIAFRLRRIV
jgi:hypothetical protein